MGAVVVVLRSEQYLELLSQHLCPCLHVFIDEVTTVAGVVGEISHFE